MRYCSQCGSQVTGESSFCSECGNKIDEIEKSANQAKPSNTQKRTDKKQRKPFTKKQKLIAISSSVAVIIIVAALALFSFFSSTERSVNGMIDAIKEKDIQTVSERIYFEELDRNLTEEEADAYLAYLHDDSDRIEQLRSDLLKQAELIGDHDYESTKELFEEEKLDNELYIKESEGKLFQDAEFYIKPSYLTISTNLPNSELLDSDGKKLFTYTEEDDIFTIGPLVRGNHEFKVAYDGEWVNMNKDLSINVNEYEKRVETPFEVDNVTFNADFGDEFEQTLIIDGQSIDDPPLNKEIGPFLIDEQSFYEYRINLPWSEMTTGEQSLNDTSIDIQLQNNQLANLLENYYSMVLEGFETEDQHKVKVPYQLKEIQTERIKTFYDEIEGTNQNYHAVHYGGYEIGNQLGDLTLDWSGTWSLTVPVVEELAIIHSDQPTENLEYKQYPWQYVFEFEDGEWILDSFSSQDVPEDFQGTYEYSYSGDLVEIIQEETDESDDGHSDESVKSADKLSESEAEQLVQQNLREMQETYEKEHEKNYIKIIGLVTEDIFDPDKDTDETQEIVSQVVSALEDYVAEHYIDEIARGFLYEYVAWAHGDGLINGGNVGINFEIVNQDTDSLIVRFDGIGVANNLTSSAGGQYQLEYIKENNSILLSGLEYTNAEELDPLTFKEIETFHAKKNEEIELVEVLNDDGVDYIIVEVLNSEEPINELYYNLDDRMVDYKKSEYEASN